MVSIWSLVWRKPAVSINLNNIPWIWTLSSITSRVVPAIEDTMALSSFNKAFNKVDFPTLVSPTMATGTPSFIALPKPKLAVSFLTVWWISWTRSFKWLRSANSTSSSAKSNSNSTNETNSNSWFLRIWISLEKPPRIWSIASCWAARLEEAIRSETASAWVKSIFPFI